MPVPTGKLFSFIQGVLLGFALAIITALTLL